MTSSKIVSNVREENVQASDDGMAWLEHVEQAPPPSALDEVGSAARLALYAAVRRSFDELNQRGKFTRKSLAERLATSPELVARLLRSPTNMTIETAAKLLFAMGKELSIRAVDPSDKVRIVACVYDKSQSVHAEHAHFSAGAFTIVAAVTDKVKTPHAFFAFPNDTSPGRLSRTFGNQKIEIRSADVIGAPFSVIPQGATTVSEEVA